MPSLNKQIKKKYSKHAGQKFIVQRSGRIRGRFRGFKRLCSSYLQQILTASRKLLISSHQILPAQTRPAWLQSNTFLKRWNNIYAITWSNFTALQLWLTRTSSLPTRTHKVQSRATGKQKGWVFCMQSSKRLPVVSICSILTCF